MRARGETLTVDIDAAIQIDVAVGGYEIRFAGVAGDAANATLRSDWVPFEVRP